MVTAGPFGCGWEGILAWNLRGPCYPDLSRDVGGLLAAGHRAGSPRPVEHIVLALVS